MEEKLGAVPLGLKWNTSSNMQGCVALNISRYQQVYYMCMYGRCHLRLPPRTRTLMSDLFYCIFSTLFGVSQSYLSFLSASHFTFCPASENSHTSVYNILYDCKAIKLSSDL